MVLDHMAHDFDELKSVSEETWNELRGDVGIRHRWVFLMIMLTFLATACISVGLTYYFMKTYFKQC